MTTGVIYGSNFEDLALGGIANFVEYLARDSGVSSNFIYFTAYQSEKFYDAENVFVENSFLRLGRRISLPHHLTFGIGLREHKDQIAKCENIILHRPEYALFLQKQKYFLVLHGASGNSFRAQGILKGFLHYFFEIFAVFRAEAVFAVNPEGLFKFTHFLAKRVVPIRVPLNPVFIDTPPNWKTNPILFSASRLEPEKRIISILNIAKKLQWPMILVGTGSLERTKEFQEKIALNVRIQTLGWLAPDVLAKLYTKSGYFIALGIAEGYPLACVEALASGLQVLSISGLTGISQLEPYGLIVAKNEEELIHLLESRVLRNNSEFRANLIRDHSAGNILQEMMHFLDNDSQDY